MNIKSILRQYITNLFQWHKEYYNKMKDRYCLKKKGIILDYPDPEIVLNAPYCFVLSTGRCGTGLLTKIFETSSALWVHHNPKPELEYVSSLIHRLQPEIDTLKLAILSARFDLFFLEAFMRGRIFVETNNRIIFFAPALSELLPNAKFIHLVRNPANFVRSGMRRGYYQDDFVMLHQRLKPYENESWNTMTPLEKIGYEWNEVNSAVENFKTKVDSSKIETIKSEKLYTDTKTIVRIFDFLGIKNPLDDRAMRKIISKPVNKQIEGSFPKYQEWTDLDRSSLIKVASLASVYGYKL